MTKRLIAYAATVGILVALCACTPLLADHSFHAQCDETQMVTIAGKVTKVQWKNPHVEVNMDVNCKLARRNEQPECAHESGMEGGFH
jgi:Family of unknown function (DUF6152)